MSAKYHQSLLENAHKHSIFHIVEVSDSSICSCFYCLSVFKPSEIKEWVDEDDERGKTAICPQCGIDSVIGDKSGFPVKDEIFLKEMNSRWFGTD